MTHSPAATESYREILDAIDEGFTIIEMIEDKDGNPLDYRFLEGNAAFERQTGLVKAMGRTMREMAPTHEQHWFDTYGRIARTRQPERFEDRADALGRWYDVYAFPIGEPEQKRVAILFRDIIDRKRSELALRESEARYRAFVTANSDVVYRMSADWSEMQELDGRGFVADTLGPLTGWRETYLEPEDRAIVDRGIHDAIESKGLFELEHRVRRIDGSIGWTISRAAPIVAPDGEIIEWLGTARDITERKTAEAALRASEERMRMLLAELQHRVRNILSVVRSVFTRTANAGGPIDEIVSHFSGRLDNLARTQVIATQSASGRVDLENLIRDELLSVGVGDGPKLTIGGPEVALDAKAAETMGLALHELTTNAVKYGALEVPRGSVDIRWDVNMGCEGAQKLRLTWLERGVPAVPTKPLRRGFGTELIVDALPYQLDAETSLDFQPGGIRCTITVPLVSAGRAIDLSRGAGP